MKFRSIVTLGLTLFIPLLSPAAPGPADSNAPSIVVGVGLSSTLHLPGLKRAALGNSKLAKVRALPPDILLITGLREGRTMVRTWTHDGRELAHVLDVIPARESEDTSQPHKTDVVRVRLEFLEVDAATSRSLGLRWPDTLQFSAQSALSGDSRTTGINYGFQMASAKGWFRYLVQSGNARLLAEPEIYVRLGEKADFHSGGEFPVPSLSENFGRVQKQVQWKSFGTTVSVKPRSWDHLTFRSDIEVEISEVSKAFAVEGVPSLTRRKLQTKISSRDGETVVLSGLTRQMENTMEEGIPVLSQIPILGGLFSQTSKTRENLDILLSITLAFRTASPQKARRMEVQGRYERALPNDGP